MTDIYDELDPVVDDGPDADIVDFAPPASDLFVCDELVDGELCGVSFPKKQALVAHKMGKHRDHSKDKRGGPGSRGGTSKTTKSRARATSNKESAPRKAATAAEAPHTDRAGTYTASLSMFALGAYLAIPPFDNYDLDVCNRGAPGLGAALAELAQDNATVRTTCDLILGGGAGGAYIQLLLACAAIAVPIASHHGLVPASAGARFAELSGAPSPVASAPAAPSPPASDSPRSAQPDFANMSADDVFAFFSQVPPTVLFDLAGKMFGADNAIVVDVGPVPEGNVQQLTDEQILSVVDAYGGEHVERGSEQLAPDSVPVPT